LSQFDPILITGTYDMSDGTAVEKYQQTFSYISMEIKVPVL